MKKVLNEPFSYVDEMLEGLCAAHPAYYKQAGVDGRVIVRASGATPGKAVGLFYLGLAHKNGVFSRKHEFHGDRVQNKQSAADAALSWLKEYLISLPG